MTVRMIALKSFPYAGRRVKKGAEFDARGRLNAPGSDATVLQAIRHAKPKPAEAPRAMEARPQRTYQTRVMVPEQPAPFSVPAPEIVTKGPSAEKPIEEMEAGELHALARARGVQVHPRAGAEKVRQALREADQDTRNE